MVRRNHAPEIGAEPQRPSATPVDQRHRGHVEHVSGPSSGSVFVQYTITQATPQSHCATTASRATWLVVPGVREQLAERVPDATMSSIRYQRRDRCASAGWPRDSRKDDVSVMRVTAHTANDGRSRRRVSALYSQRGHSASTRKNVHGETEKKEHNCKNNEILATFRI